MNHIILIGRLTHDPEVRSTQSGASVANFTLAVDRPVSQGQEKQTDFIRCIVWNKVADSCAKYLSKGNLAGVHGRLQIRNYEDKTGAKRQAVEIVASEVKFLEKKKQQDTDLSDVEFDDLKNMFPDE